MINNIKSEVVANKRYSNALKSPMQISPYTHTSIIDVCCY